MYRADVPTERVCFSGVSGRRDRLALSTPKCDYSVRTELVEVRTQETPFMVRHAHHERLIPGFTELL